MCICEGLSTVFKLYYVSNKKPILLKEDIHIFCVLKFAERVEL